MKDCRPPTRNSQLSRVEDLRREISGGEGAPVGRTIPDADDLVIGAGRRLPLTSLFTDICGSSSRASLTADHQEMNSKRALACTLNVRCKLAPHFSNTSCDRPSTDSVPHITRTRPNYRRQNRCAKEDQECQSPVCKTSFYRSLWWHRFGERRFAFSTGESKKGYLRRFSCGLRRFQNFDAHRYFESSSLLHNLTDRHDADSVIRSPHGFVLILSGPLCLV